MIHLIKTFLPIAEKIYDRKATMDILHHICIRDGFIQMTDLEIFMRMPINHPDNFTIPIKLLKKVLSTKPQTVTLEVLNNDRARVNFDNKHLAFPTLNTDEYPAFPNESFTKVSEWNRDVFLQLSKQSAFASTDTLRPALTGIYVKQNSALSSVATNGHILQWNKNLGSGNTLLQDFETIIPVRFIKLIGKFAGHKTEVSVSEKYLGFKLSNGTELCVRKIEEPYVDFERVIPLELPNQIILSKEKLLKQIKSAKPFTEKAMLKANNGSLELNAEDFDENLQYQSSMKVESREGKELDVYLNLNLLEKTVNSMDTELIEWKYIDADSPNILSSDANVLHLLMPIRRMED